MSSEYEISSYRVLQRIVSFWEILSFVFLKLDEKTVTTLMTVQYIYIAGTSI